MHVKIHAIGEHDCANCGIREQSLFKNLNSADFKLIDQPIHDLVLEAHATVFNEGDAGDFVFTVRSGLVKLVRFQADGTQRIIRLLTAGDIAGLESTAEASYDSTAIALTPVTACRIPVDVIHRLEKDSPRLHSQLVHKWHEALKHSEDFIADLASGSARQRLARLLMRLAGPHHADDLLLPSREDVGAMLGITTETASRTVAAFRREGLMINLDKQGRHFRVKVEELAAVASRTE